MAATGQTPDVFQTPTSQAQLVVAPSPSRQAARPLTPAVELSVPVRGFYRLHGKRIFDLVFGLALLVALLPLLVVVAAVVLMMSGWPVFYGSERVGLSGKRFQMWKFRTMVRDADTVFERWKETQPERAAQLLTDWKLEADPRVTAIGRFLRKASLDELPQLWNVMCGEMSIAGPRPYLSRESLDPDLARAIVSVRPGLTGPFQVRGRKSLHPLARMRLEAAYAADVRLRLDLAYIVRTAKPLMELDGH